MEGMDAHTAGSDTGGTGDADRVEVRDYLPSDAAATRALFCRAVMVTTARDYTPGQRLAWLSRSADLTLWDARRRAAATFVATLDGVPVGFAGVTDGDVLDMLFVAPTAGRRGVGSALLRHALDHARARGATRVTAQASHTALPFLLAHGFVEVSPHEVVIGSEVLGNHLVALDLATPGTAPAPPAADPGPAAPAARS